MKQEHDYLGTGYEPPYTSSEVSSFLSRNGSNNRPKLRSIVITRAVNDNSKYRESSGGSSHDRPQKSLTKKSKLHKQDRTLKKLKEESSAGPSAMNNSHMHHRGGSHSPHSSHRYEGSGRCSSKSNGSTRHKHSKKDEKKKKKSKRQKDSESSTERKAHESKSKKRKRILSLFSDSSDD
jgi:hypothetical protein